MPRHGHGRRVADAGLGEAVPPLESADRLGRARAILAVQLTVVVFQHGKPALYAHHVAPGGVAAHVGGDRREAVGVNDIRLDVIAGRSVHQIRPPDDEIQSVLDEFTKKKNLDLCLMVFTSILDNGSIVYRAGDKSDWALEAFPDKDNEVHSLQKGVLSRKSQIVPILTATIQKYS